MNNPRAYRVAREISLGQPSPETPSDYGIAAGQQPNHPAASHYDAPSQNGEAQATGTPMGALVHELTAVMGGNDVLAAHGKLMTALKNVQAEMQVLQMEKRKLEDNAKYTADEVTRLSQAARQHELTAQHYRRHRDMLEEALMGYAAASERDQNELKHTQAERIQAVAEVNYLTQRMLHAHNTIGQQAQQVDQLSQALAAANGALAEAEDKLANGTVKTEDPENRPNSAKPAEERIMEAAAPLFPADPVNTQSPQTAFEKQMAEEDAFRAKVGIQAAEETVKEGWSGPQGWYGPQGFKDVDGTMYAFNGMRQVDIEAMDEGMRAKYDTWCELPETWSGTETEAAAWIAQDNDADVE